MVKKMNKQHFDSYLIDYVRDISGMSSLNVRKLVDASKSNYRITSSLMLYCVFFDKKHLFNRYTDSRYEKVLGSLTKSNWDNPEFNEFGFTKIHESYQHKINRAQYDNQIKDSVRDRLNALLKKKGVSKYRLCKDLHLNVGNVNAYLHNGDYKKVSLAVVKDMMNYLKALPDLNG